jgi:hypothetical protein
MINPFLPIAAMAGVTTRIVETLGVPYADPFNEEAIIADTNDPEKLGRVKVTTNDNLTSNWIPVSGSNRGTLSSRYIGAKVLIGKTNGRSENMHVIGIVRDDPEVGIAGNPIQLPIIDESMAVWNDSTDPGMKCNEGNQGRAYILSNEMNQDFVVCMRRTSKQVGSKDMWAWKSLTNGLWVEKGVNPGNQTTPAITQAQTRNPGIPECTESLLGETHEYTEDRGFRTTTMVCRRDENKNYGWLPMGSPPVFFRSALPKCTEKIHGMDAVVDDGNNSEHVVCQRYQKLMRWVKHGRRIPQQFYSKDKPLNRVEFMSSLKNIPALEEKQAKPKGMDWVDKSIASVAFDEAIRQIELTGTDPALKLLLRGASLIPETAFDGARAMKSIARVALNARTGIPVEEITDVIQSELNESGSVSQTTQTILDGVGSAADVLVNGVKDGDVDGALFKVGTATLRAAVNTLDPRAGSVMTGLLSGGIIGAVDSAVAIGLDQLPPEVNKYVSPVVNIASDLLKSKYPASLGNILDSAVKGGLTDAISGTISTAFNSNLVSPGVVQSVSKAVLDGALGAIPKLFGSVSNLDQIKKLPAPANSVPTLASTALGLIGQGKAMSDLLGQGGIGLDSLGSLVGGGFNPATTILSGVKGLGGLFAGKSGGSECPCGPGCRKTEHGEDSDGNNVLDQCGSVTSTGSNSYNPTGDALNNNNNPVSKENGTESTKLDEELTTPNRKDLTQTVQKVQRVRDAGKTNYDSRFADMTERALEMAKSFEGVEKALKAADNNITGVESIERKLIDSVFNILSSILYSNNRKNGNVPVLSNLLEDVRQNSEAIKDVYNFVKALDQVKSGGRAGVRVTPNIANAFQNIPDLGALASLNKKQALRILNQGIIPADKEWRELDPGPGFNSTLGAFTPPVPIPFPSEKTLFDRDRIIAETAKSKIDDDFNASTGDLDLNQSVFDQSLSRNQLDSLKQSEYFSSVEAGSGVLNNTSDGTERPRNPGPGESSLYDTIANREGQTNCG